MKGRTVEVADPATLADLSVAVLALGDDELSRAGEHAEGLVAEAGRVLRPGGLLLASARNPLLLPTGSELRGYLARQLAAALEHRGFTVELLCSPGAAARLTGGGGYDPERDRLPGLLDAGPGVVAVARAPRSAAERSATFLATLPRKAVAAAVLCRDSDGRLLVVHDTFRGHWTIPGGLVDADEDPQTGAIREAWEEAGVRVATQALLGVFWSPLPDRVVFVYAATPLTPAPPRPVHAHEIDAAEWLPLGHALNRLGPRPRWQVQRCLDTPGGTWRQP